MSTLYFAEELNIPDVTSDAKYSKKELDLALTLIDSLNMKFNPEKFVDEYQENIKDAIKKKQKGVKIKRAMTKKSSNVKDLMQALEMSLKNV